MVEKLLKEQADIISQVEKDLTEIDKLEKILREERIKLVEEVDEKGKKKYANEDQRQVVLYGIKKKEIDLYELIKRRLEINRLKYDLNKQSINFYNK